MKYVCVKTDLFGPRQGTVRGKVPPSGQATRRGGGAERLEQEGESIVSHHLPRGGGGKGDFGLFPRETHFHQGEDAVFYLPVGAAGDLLVR